jgi:hypothetical protein
MSRGRAGAAPAGEIGFARAFAVLDVTAGELDDRDARYVTIGDPLEDGGQSRLLIHKPSSLTDKVEPLLCA